MTVGQPVMANAGCFLACRGVGVEHARPTLPRRIAWSQAGSSMLDPYQIGLPAPRRYQNCCQEFRQETSMLYFPQLLTGAVGQYPIHKRRLSRTVVNESEGGARFKLADPDAAAVEWILNFQTMSDNERDSLTQLFNGIEGRLGDFTFLDPTDNLLCWSEKLDEPVWERNSLVTITAGVDDPDGELNANR